MRTLAIIFASALLLTLPGVAQDDDMAMLNFVVIRDYNGKPIRNASVVMHPVEKNGKQSRGGLQLKTDAEGKASFDGVPYGKLRIQVLAHRLPDLRRRLCHRQADDGDHGQDEAAAGAVFHLRRSSGETRRTRAGEARRRRIRTSRSKTLQISDCRFQIENRRPWDFQSEI